MKKEAKTEIIEYYYNNETKEIEEIKTKKKTIPLSIILNPNLFRIDIIKGLKEKHIYLGHKMNKNQDKTNDFIKDLQLDYLRRNNIEEAIFCDCNFIETKIDSNTLLLNDIILKYIEKEKNKLFVNLDDFINQLEKYFYNSKYDVTTTVSEEYTPIEDNISIEDDFIVTRKYQIYLDEYLELEINGKLGNNTLGKNQTAYIKLDKLEEQIKPLYQEHQTLKRFIDEYKIKLVKEDLNQIENVKIKNLEKY